ncbi:hypothetical protein ACIP6I_21930 [Streptomyces anulatus]
MSGRPLAEPLHPYTRALMGAFPPLTGPRVHLSGLSDAPRTVGNCGFHADCPDDRSTLPLRVRARSTRIEVLVGDRTVIDTTDGTHRRGRIGLNVFGGRAAYQDTHVTAL